MSQCNNCNQNMNQDCGGTSIYVTGAETGQAMDITNNRARYYAEMAESYKNEAKEFRDSAQYYAEQNSDVTMSYIDSLEVSLRDLIDGKQDVGEYALSSDLPEKLSDLETDDAFLSSIQATAETSGIVKPDGKTVTVDENSVIGCTDKILNTSQVTNCLLEVPQRMDYTLVDGVFTLKAGSVVIVPYGTTDLSSTINVGDTFINPDLKVYDTYWDSTNSKFYVWAELQADVVRAASASNAGIVRALALYFDSSTIGVTAYGNAESGSSDSSASNTSLFYNTSSNLVKRKDSGTILAYTCSFPIVKVISDATYMAAEVRRVFNGIGYIGAITWADKGIKGLIPNGRNADGTLKNDEFTTETLITYAVAASLGLAGYRYLCLSADTLNSVNPMNAFYDATKNTFQLSGGSHVAKIGTILTDNNGKIISQSLDGALNINSMCDGGWVDSDLTIASSVNAPSSGTPLEYDLSNYLPIDGNNYEVILVGAVYTGATSGNTVSLRVYSNILNNYQIITTAQTRSSSSVSGGGTLTLPVGLDKKIYVSSYSSNTGTFSLFARGYKRLGTNA